ncbi:hypothetical protein PHAVU_003G095600 [Phaseolus vulgaris]|uniref:Dienelactone hydrolase domain-containing protein n=1 Tax=Phaseolus vulgaris TaxID=3885 RepID=V7C7M8_PHAVU|nr:hypothetical protein PHAVU_003G095600g [Phaseolus vulgaris]ESW26157.1 hypothetical protein PHAVU_003G095600g [Phaseolus vulgaris]
MVGGGCFTNHPVLNGSSGGGNVTNIGGVNCYVSGCSLSVIAILLVSDVYGFKAPLLRKIADKVGDSGYYVVVPDLLNDDPFNPKDLKRPNDVWKKDHEPAKGFESAKPIIEALKSIGVSSMGAAGFCWGSKTVTGLGTAQLTQASVLLHPSYITVDDVRGVKTPIAILGAEHDSLSPPELVKEFKHVLDAKPEVESFVKIFPNASHGWALRYDPTNPKALNEAEAAHKIMIDWFDKHLKK